MLFTLLLVARHGEGFPASVVLTVSRDGAADSRAQIEVHLHLAPCQLQGRKVFLEGSKSISVCRKTFGTSTNSKWCVCVVMATISSVARYMSSASEAKVRNLNVTLETFGFHLVGRSTAAYASPSSWTVPSPFDAWGLRKSNT